MLKFIKDKNGFKSFQADDFKIYYGEKDSIAGDNDINPKELIYLIEGNMDVELAGESFKFIAPAEIKIPANTYHKIIALTKVSFLIFEK